jgi:hypothetical protein
VIEKCRKAGLTGKPHSSLLRTVSGPLVFVAHPGPREKRVQWLQAHVLARHTQLSEALGREVTTLGVATEPVPVAGRSHDFFLLRGNVRIEPVEKKRRDQLFR